MKLGKSETLRIFNKHNCCIWHIDPNFNNSCRYKYLNFIFPKCRHHKIYYRTEDVEAFVEAMSREMTEDE